VGGKFVGRLTYRHSSQGAQGIDCLHGAHGPAGVPQLSGFWQVDLQATPLHSSSEPQLSGASRAALSSWVQAHHRPAHRRHASLRACFDAYSSRELHVNLRGKISSYAKGINESPSSPPCACTSTMFATRDVFPQVRILIPHFARTSVPSPCLFPLLVFSLSLISCIYSRAPLLEYGEQLPRMSSRGRVLVRTSVSCGCVGGPATDIPQRCMPSLLIRNVMMHVTTDKPERRFCVEHVYENASRVPYWSFGKSSCQSKSRV